MKTLCRCTIFLYCVNSLSAACVWKRIAWLHDGNEKLCVLRLHQLSSSGQPGWQPAHCGAFMDWDCSYFLLLQQLSGLWYHNRTNHPEVFANQNQPLKNLVQCDACFKFFPSAASLARHQTTEHQGEWGQSAPSPHTPAHHAELNPPEMLELTEQLNKISWEKQNVRPHEVLSIGK